MSDETTAMMSTNGGTTLTLRQARFVEEYVADPNATQAAIRAGYSAKTARWIGSENLAKPYIAAAVREAQASLAERTRVTQEAVIAALVAVVAEARATEPPQLGTAVAGLKLIGQHIGMWPAHPSAEGVDLPGGFSITITRRPEVVEGSYVPLVTRFILDPNSERGKPWETESKEK